MRTLPAGLAAKISAPGQQPELSVVAQDLVQRLAVFASSGTPGRSSAIISSTGTILRAVLAQAAPTNQTLTVQTIAPATPSSWTAPPVTVTTNAVASAGCCIVQTGSTTRVFYQRSSDSLVCYRDSSDDGLTWSGELTIPTIPLGMVFCYGIAADSITNLWTQWATFDPNGCCAFWYTTFTSSWSAWLNTGPGTPAYCGLRGISATKIAGVTHFAVGAGMRGYTSGISAAWFTWDGISYSGMDYIQQLDTPSQGLALSYPDISYDPSDLLGDGLQWYATVLLTDDGSVSTSAHTRTSIYRSLDGQNWQPWLNAGTSFQYGAHVLVTGGVAYLFDATTCYTIPGSPAPIDLSDDVLSLSIHEQYNTPSQVEIVLSNNAGQHTEASFLVDNATLTIALGYGGQTITTHTLYIDDWSLQANAEELTLTIACRDILKILDYPSTLLLSYTSETLTHILTALFRQAGVPLAALPATVPFSQVVSCFVITPGETWLSALKRLASLYTLVFYADGAPSVIISDPQITDASTWSYGTEALATEHGQESNRPNVIRVTGATTPIDQAWSEATDPANILLVGAERYQLIVDRMLHTSGKCLLRAQQELRLVQRQATHGTIIAAPNPQHQLTDVVTYTDESVGAGTTTMRINRMTWIVSPRAGMWEHHLTLEAP